MASYSLPARYQSYLAGDSLTAFAKRQVSSVADALPGVIARGLSKGAPSTPGAPGNPGLPDVSGIDKTETSPMVYVGAGAAVLLVLALVMGRRKKVA